MVHNLILFDGLSDSFRERFRASIPSYFSIPSQNLLGRHHLLSGRTAD